MLLHSSLTFSGLIPIVVSHAHVANERGHYPGEKVAADSPMTQSRTRILEHSIGRVRLMKFVLSPGATVPEVVAVFGSVVSECVQHGLRATLVVAEDRPAMTPAELKSAVGVLDLSERPGNFRLAVVAFRESAYLAYLYALGALANRGSHRVFCDEMDAMEWLREQFADPRQEVDV
jgi:hypothetical protein